MCIKENMAGVWHFDWEYTVWKKNYRQIINVYCLHLLGMNKIVRYARIVFFFLKVKVTLKKSKNLVHIL